MKILFVVDMQESILNEALKEKPEETKALIENVAKRVEEYDKNKWHIRYTRNMALKYKLENNKSLQDAEEEVFNIEPAVLSKQKIGTTGQNVAYMDKLTDSGYNNFYGFSINTMREYGINENYEFEIVGLYTEREIFFAAALLKSSFYSAKVIVNKECCLGHEKITTQETLNALKNAGIEII